MSISNANFLAVATSCFTPPLLLLLLLLVLGLVLPRVSVLEALLH